MKKWIIIYVVIIFTVLGVGMAVHQDKVWEEVIVSGTVTDFKSYRGKRGTKYEEIISFELNGIGHQLAYRAFWGGKLQIGRVREVAANPEYPNQARVRLGPWLEKLLPPVLKQNLGIIFWWLVGCVFFGIGWFKFVGRYEFFRQAIIVQGKVIAYAGSIFRKYSGGYTEMVSYNFDGQRRTVRADMPSPLKPKIDSERKVGIDPQDMQKVRVYSGTWYCFWDVLWGLIAWSVLFF